MRTTPRQRRALAVAALLAASALLAVLALRHQSPTYDEAGHLRYGQGLLAGEARFEGGRFGVAKMPVSAVNALPWAVAERLGLERAATRLATRWHAPIPPSSHVGPEQVRALLVGRLSTVLASLLLAGVVYLWSRRLHGTGGGLLSLALAALCPNLLGHTLVTTDVWAAATVALASWRFGRFLDDGGWRRGGLAGAALGLAQLAKYTSVLLYPVFAAVAAVRAAPRWWRLARAGRWLVLAAELARAAAIGALVAAVSLAVLNLGYLGEGSGARLGERTLHSERLAGLQERVLRWADPPLPLPGPWLEGLDIVTHYEATGSGFGHLYLLGELRLTGPELEGFAGYFLVACLFKLPLATQLLILAGAAAWTRRGGRSRPPGLALALWLPLAAIVVYFNFFYKAQIGIRHFLVALPFLFVVAGAAAGWARRFPAARWAIAGLAAWLVASVAWRYPHYLSYVNELVPDRARAYRVLADSNLDWGQDEWTLGEDLERHPRTRVGPRRPVAGRVVVSVNERVGVLYPGRYWWLEELEPVAAVGGSYLVYEVAPEDLPGPPRRPPPSPG